MGHDSARAAPRPDRPTWPDRPAAARSARGFAASAAAGASCASPTTAASSSARRGAAAAPPPPRPRPAAVGDGHEASANPRERGRPAPAARAARRRRRPRGAQLGCCAAAAIWRSRRASRAPAAHDARRRLAAVQAAPIAPQFSQAQRERPAFAGLQLLAGALAAATSHRPRRQRQHPDRGQAVTLLEQQHDKGERQHQRQRHQHQANGGRTNASKRRSFSCSSSVPNSSRRTCSDLDAGIDQPAQ